MCLMAIIGTLARRFVERVGVHGLSIRLYGTLFFGARTLRNHLYTRAVS